MLGSLIDKISVRDSCLAQWLNYYRTFDQDDLVEVVAPYQMRL